MSSSSEQDRDAAEAVFEDFVRSRLCEVAIPGDIAWARLGFSMEAIESVRGRVVVSLF
jgi:hypothetical protein